MKQNLSFEQTKTSFNFKSQDPNQSNHLEKTADINQLKKALADSLESNQQKQHLIASLEKELKLIEHEQHKIDSDILKSQLELETVKLENLEKKHQYEEEKQQQEEQNQMDMNAWLNEVQKYNGLPQAAIDSLCAMEYEGNPLDSEICLTCYKEMKTGEMAKYLPCAHLFHMKCIDEHLKVSRMCPACMEQVVI